jgi:hypothetical protein
MSMLGKMLGGQIAEGEAALQAIDADLTIAEGKILPFINKVAPQAGPILTELVDLSPTLKALVTPAEISEFAEGLASIPGLLTAMHNGIVDLEGRLKKI